MILTIFCGEDSDHYPYVLLLILIKLCAPRSILKSFTILPAINNRGDVADWLKRLTADAEVATVLFHSQHPPTQ
jgi:hypothetical protein